MVLRNPKCVKKTTLLRGKMRTGRNWTWEQTISRPAAMAPGQGRFRPLPVRVRSVRRRLR